MVARIIAVVMTLAGVAATAAPATLSEAETTAIYKGADFVVRGGFAMGCNTTSNTAAPASRFTFDSVDLSGDGNPEVILTEINAVCFGRQTQAFSIMVRNADGSWRKVGGATGIAVPLDTRQSGWRDIEYGGPALKLRPVLHWDGTKYQ